MQHIKKANRKSKINAQKCKWTSQCFSNVFPFCFSFLFVPFILLLCFLDFADLLFGFSIFFAFFALFSSLKKIRISGGLVKLIIERSLSESCEETSYRDLVQGSCQDTCSGDLVQRHCVEICCRNFAKRSLTYNLPRGLL